MSAVLWFDDDPDEEPEEDGLPPLGRLLSAADAQKVIGIPAARIRKWAERKDRTGLERAGIGWRDYPLYWEADLIALMRGIPIRDEQGFRLVEEVPK